MARLTEFERKALEVLRDAGARGARASAVGFVLWEKCDPETRKKNPSPQGMALFAGRFLGELSQRNLIYPGNEGWAINAAGRAALEAA